MIISPKRSFEVFVDVSKQKRIEWIRRDRRFLARQKYFESKENDQNETVERDHQRVKPPPTIQTIERHKSSREIVNKQDQNAQRSQLLELAMDWDCIDVAKTFILQNSLDNILVSFSREKRNIREEEFRFRIKKRHFSMH